jgi:hypothetical protein
MKEKLIALDAALAQVTRLVDELQQEVLIRRKRLAVMELRLSEVAWCVESAQDHAREAAQCLGDGENNKEEVA